VISIIGSLLTPCVRAQGAAGQRRRACGEVLDAIGEKVYAETGQRTPLRLKTASPEAHTGARRRMQPVRLGAGPWPLDSAL
jgi:hypothetical protein